MEGTLTGRRLGQSRGWPTVPAPPKSGTLSTWSECPATSTTLKIVPFTRGDPGILGGGGGGQGPRKGSSVGIFKLAGQKKVC